MSDMRNITTSIHKIRKAFMQANEHRDHAIIEGHNDILFSVPHAVNQVRLGKLKYKEIGSMAVAMYLAEKTGGYLIAKTKNNSDDANFDENCKYRDSISRLIETKGIKYVIDMHGLASNRPCDINLGIHLGKNISTNVPAYDSLRKILKNAGFNTDVSNYGERGYFSADYSPDDDIETIRVHIRHLRSKLDKIADGKKYISTIYGGGYKFEV